MIYFKTKESDDPYYDLWHSPEWLFPFENKDKFVFPKILTVEPVNICQNRCIYCGMRLMDRKSGYMSAEIMKKIVDEAALHGASIRFGGFGEPLLHKEITKFVKICKEKKVRTTIFTNARMLNEDMMKAFCDAGLDEIRFSSSGVTESEHREIRRNSDWDKDLYQKILLAHRVKSESKSKSPYLTLYTIVFDYENENFRENVDKYVKHFMNYVDKIDIDLINLTRVKHLDEVKAYYPKTTVKQIYKPCVTLYHKMLIHWNGDVFACDMAYNYEETYYCGNLNSDMTISKMYKLPKVENLRKMTQSLEHGNLSLCKVCYQNTYKYEKLKDENKKGACHEKKAVPEKQ